MNPDHGLQIIGECKNTFYTEMRMIFNEFDQIYCVNLKRDIARKERMLHVLSEQDINLEKIIWMSADPPYEKYSSSNYQFGGELGCTLSHLKCIIHSMSISIKYGILILEDDLVFHEDAAKNFTTAMKTLPNDWNVLYLGGCPKAKLTRVSQYLCSVGKFLQTAGYAINKTFINELAMFTCDRIGKEFPNACADNILNDYILKSRGTGYCLYPPIIEQEDGYSTLRKGHRAYKDMIRNEWYKYQP